MQSWRIVLLAILLEMKSSCLSMQKQIVEFFNETDGMNLLWSDPANYQTTLNYEINKGVSIIRGDVILGTNGIPVMASGPNGNNTMSLRLWLKTVAASRKGVKLVFHKTNVIKAAMEYLFAAKYSLTMPVFLQADIVSGPNGERTGSEVIDPDVFIRNTQRYFPKGVVSVSWRTDIRLEDDELQSYTWREILDMLEYTHDLRGFVNYHFRASYLEDSVFQLLWLLGVRQSYSITVFSERYAGDAVANWMSIIALRRWGDSSRIFYDINPSVKRETFLDEYQQFSSITPRYDVTKWNRAKWRIVQFITADTILSTIITSDIAVAFVGWPTAFLLSLSTFDISQSHTVSGRVLFVAKRHWKEEIAFTVTGLSIFLLPSVDDIVSPLLKDGIRVFIGYDGTIFIENREVLRSRYLTDTFNPQSFAKVATHDCYAFTIVCKSSSVILTTFASRSCSGSVKTPPTAGWYRQISLKLPHTTKSRFVIVQKSGDANMDAIVEQLHHSNISLQLQHSFLLLVCSYCIIIYFKKS